ncbi:MAG: hypothetical protein AUJ98_02995 [Bacteroidetes bacterium CG2_30_33_31]|nr:MAG: hypothetical protein AUJ98_02995 [Bacteroidetes bacterium CG2_30_33_31]
MEIIALILIALSLTFDTFAISVSSGIAVSKISFRQAFIIASIFAIFQAGMPIIGWIIGYQINDFYINYNYFVAIILLTLIGLKMIWDAIRYQNRTKSFNPLKPIVMIGLAIATSIDALAVGFSFAFIQVNIMLATLIIGISTFLMAMTGMLFGKHLGNKIGKKAEIIGGLVLILLALKILWDKVL